VPRGGNFCGRNARFSRSLHTRYVTKGLLRQIDALDEEIQAIEEKMREVLSPTREVRLLETLPGVGFILAVVIRAGGG